MKRLVLIGIKMRGLPAVVVMDAAAIKGAR